jgi:hypothetical protein
MSSNDIHGIGSGWSVKTSDGQKIGSVEETTDRYILVKSGLINSTERYLPAAVLEHVRPELKDIGIALTKAQVEEGDWSEPPAQPPRSEGAPLNTDEYLDERDPVARGPREPERPDRI